ncbi:MAG: hypothetical protein IPK46_08915 [Saprospiraceae bacterium]|nr:hypothetical protein [Saprospiraceae bacterium]
MTSSLDPSLTHTYNVKNNYTVTLSLRKSNGCSNSFPNSSGSPPRQP